VDWTAILIAAVGGLGGPGAVVALYKWAKAQGRADVLAEQAVDTVKAKDEEIAGERAAKEECQVENRRLWALVETLQKESRP
jgi:hypothetical protein